MYRQYSDYWKNPAFEASFWNWEWRMRGEETRDGQSPIDRWRVFMPPPIPPFPHSPPWNHPLGLLCQSVFVTQYNLGLSDKGRNLFWIFCFSSSSSSSSLSLFPPTPLSPTPSPDIAWLWSRWSNGTYGNNRDWFPDSRNGGNRQRTRLTLWSLLTLCVLCFHRSKKEIMDVFDK